MGSLRGGLAVYIFTCQDVVQYHLFQTFLLTITIYTCIPHAYLVLVTDPRYVLYVNFVTWKQKESHFVVDATLRKLSTCHMMVQLLKR